jgi:hypothetical protein
MSKRERENSLDIEDIISEISNRLASLTTDDGSAEALKAECFMAVLRCPREDAEFFLDSVGGDLAQAVNLYLENRESSRDRSVDYKQLKRFGREWNITICGLPSEWTATVSELGTVYLVDEGGKRHWEVPTTIIDSIESKSGTDFSCLNQEQQEKVQELMSLADASRSAAIFCLESAVWNIEQVLVPYAKTLANLF